MTEEEILAKLKEILRDAFEIDPSAVTSQANLYEELGLDSIDAVDLAIKLQEMTGKRIKPENFKGVRTVGDVIGVVRTLLAS